MDPSPVRLRFVEVLLDFGQPLLTLREGAGDLAPVLLGEAIIIVALSLFFAALAFRAYRSKTGVDPEGHSFVLALCAVFLFFGLVYVAQIVRFWSPMGYALSSVFQGVLIAALVYLVVFKIRTHALRSIFETEARVQYAEEAMRRAENALVVANARAVEAEHRLAVVATERERAEARAEAAEADAARARAQYLTESHERKAEGPQDV